MFYKKAWEHLKQDIEIQQELSQEITINKLLARMEEIEEKEEQYWNSSNLPF